MYCCRNAESCVNGDGVLWNPRQAWLSICLFICLVCGFQIVSRLTKSILDCDKLLAIFFLDKAHNLFPFDFQKQKEIFDTLERLALSALPSKCAIGLIRTKSTAVGP